MSVVAIIVLIITAIAPATQTGPAFRGMHSDRPFIALGPSTRAVLFLGLQILRCKAFPEPGGTRGLTWHTCTSTSKCTCTCTCICKGTCTCISRCTSASTSTCYNTCACIGACTSVNKCTCAFSFVCKCTCRCSCTCASTCACI